MSENDLISRYGPLIGAIDAGTSSVRFLVFAAKTAEVLTYHQVEITQICPQEGWFEQDPIEILNAVKECIKKTVHNLKQLNIDPCDIVAVGLTNQRETTILWDCLTGDPIYNAIVWMDMRTTGIIDDLLKNIRNQNKDCLKKLCGLPLSPYFSALKIKWILKYGVRSSVILRRKRCLFGTVDSWLIWNLTGGVNDGVHCTDVTNASRTMLMNLSTLQWDPYLLQFFDIPHEILPEIRSSSEIYGHFSEGFLRGVPISGCLGDQQAALVGHMCFQQGQAKSTYGTGCFLLYNTGNAIVDSHHGLLTTVAYQMGPQADPVYALEGSIAIAGQVIKWLKNNLEIFNDVSEIEDIMQSITKDSNVVFVPAFSGLYAPYWRKDARGVICGINAQTTSAHFLKAALQSVCFQVKDILESMTKDTGLPLTKLLVDGAMTSNSLLMQMQADICGIPVVRPEMTEITALGAAIAAGCAEGVKKWDIDLDSRIPSDTFVTTISETGKNIFYMLISDGLDDSKLKIIIFVPKQEMLFYRWKNGIQRSLCWDVADELALRDGCEDISHPTTIGFYLFTTLVVLVVAKYRTL